MMIHCDARVRDEKDVLTLCWNRASEFEKNQ